MNETAKVLRKFNAWRRGAQEPQPAQRDVGNAIDRAIEIIEQHDRLAEAVILTLAENAHLADGEGCTLYRLKDVIEGCV